MKLIMGNRILKIIMISYFLIFMEFINMKYSLSKKNKYKRYYSKNMNLNKFESNSSKYLKNHEHSKNKNFEVSTTKPPFFNPLGNLVGGLAEEMATGETKFFQCFPSSWLQNKGKNEADDKQNSQLSGNFSKWGDGLKAIFTMGAPIIDFFCKFREKIIMFFQGLFMRRKLRKLRFMFESGNESNAMNLLKKRYSWGFGSMVKGLSNAKNWVANQASNVGKFVKQGILDPFFNTFINPIKNKFMSLIQSFKDFFTGGFMGTIKNCMDALSSTQGKLQKLFQGLKSKFDQMRTAVSLGLPGIIAFVADFLIAMICEHKVLVPAIDLILKGLDNKDMNIRNFNIGKGFGIFLRTYSFAPTFTGKILNKSKFKRLYFK